MECLSPHSPRLHRHGHSPSKMWRKRGQLRLADSGPEASFSPRPANSSFARTLESPSNFPSNSEPGEGFNFLSENVWFDKCVVCTLSQNK